MDRMKKSRYTLSLNKPFEAGIPSPCRVLFLYLKKGELMKRVQQPDIPLIGKRTRNRYGPPYASMIR